MKKLTALLISILLLLAFSMGTSAFSQNDLDYCLDEDQEPVYTSKTYEHVKTLSYINGAQPAELRNPEDLFIDSKGEVYIADTGNNRIVRTTLDGTLIAVYANESDPFYQPTVIMNAWILVLLFVALLQMNTYSFGKTVGVAVLSVIGIVLVWVVLLLAFAFVFQIVMFVRELLQELQIISI